MRIRRSATSRSAVRPALPSVNLLSDSAFARLAARRLRRWFVAGAVVLLFATGSGWVVQNMRVHDAGKMLSVEQAETGRLTTQTQQLLPVRVYVNGVAAQQQMTSEAMSGEVYLSDVLAGIRDAATTGMQLTSLSISISAVSTDAAAAPATDPAAGSTAIGTQAQACPGPDPFGTHPVIGCVMVSGTAPTRADVGSLVIGLGDSRLFVEPFISTTTTADGSAVTFSGSVGLSDRVFSRRYGDPAPTTQDTQDTQATEGDS